MKIAATNHFPPASSHTQTQLMRDRLGDRSRSESVRLLECGSSERSAAGRLSGPRRPALWLILAGLVALHCVAGCAARRSTIPEFHPPTVFTQGTPSLPQLIQQTNRSLAIQSLGSNTLTITSPDLAHKLTGNFSWLRPHNLRLETRLFSSALGTPLAAGSNEEMFWLHSQRPSPTLYFARYDQFESQPGARLVLPVSPLWLREAFGVVELDPQGKHQGPTTRADGKLQVVSMIPSPRGDYRRVLVMAPSTGTIEETLLYNQTGKLVAHARMTNHQYYSGIDWSLPHRVQVQLHPDVGDPLSFTVDVGFYLTNDQTLGSGSFRLPDTTGLSTVDLVRANAQLQQEMGAQTQGLPAAQILPPVAPATGGTTAAGPVSAAPSTIPPVYRTANSNPLGTSWQSYQTR